jgi:ABC-type nitrate/sulfonate/bicarbonate transport system permease component
MLVPVIALAGLGVLLTATVRWFEQRVAPWKAAT